MTIPTWLRDESIELEKRDRFGVQELVGSTIELLRAAPTPFALSLSGTWGVGKTTIAREIERGLKKQPPLPVCYVDVWTEDIANLRKTLVVGAGAALSGKTPEVVAEEIDARILRTISTTRDKAEFSGRILKKETWQNQWRLLFGALLVLVLLLLVTLATNYLTDLMGVWGWVNLTAAGLVGSLLAFLVLRSGLFLSVYTESESNAASVSVEVALKDEFASLVGPKAKAGRSKVVVIVDNLDRLRADDALLALAEIRALIDIDGSRCVFVIPLDRTAFVEQLSDKLGDRSTARDYLDKFFNLDLQLLAPAPMQIHQFAADLAQTLLGRIIDDDAAKAEARHLLVRTVVAGSNESPRYVTRVLNGVATRHWMLRREAIAADVAMIAAVEVLATTAPDIAWLMTRDPVFFMETRTRVLETTSAETQRREVRTLLTHAASERRRSAPDEASAGSGAVGSARERAAEARTVETLRRFLAATHFLDMTAEKVELIARLRPDPIWNGIDNGVAIRSALLDGDESGLAGALPKKSSDRRPVLDAAVEEIDELLVLQQSPDALRAFVALRQAASDDDASGVRFFELAARLIGDLPVANLREPESALLKVIGDAESTVPPAQRRMVWLRLLREIEAEAQTSKPPPAYRGLIQLAVSAQKIAEPSDLAAARTAFDTASEEDADPLFEPSASIPLISDEWYDRYCQALVAWAENAVETEGAAPVEPSVAIRRLGRARDAGWTGVDRLADMADDVGITINRAAAIPDGGDETMIDLIRFLASEPPANGYAQLATSLIQHGGADIAGSALSLAIPEPAYAGVREAVGTQLRSEYDLAAWEKLINKAEERLAQIEIPLATLAIERWLADEESGFLAVALRFEHDPEAVNSAIEGVPLDATRWDRASELAAAFTELNAFDRVGRLATLLRPAIEANPLPTLRAGLAAFIDALTDRDRRASASVRLTLALALKMRAAGAAHGELPAIAELGRELREATAEIEVASGIVDRANDTNMSAIEASMLDWLLQRLYRRASVRELTVRVLTNAPDPRTVVPTIVTRAGSLAHHRDVRQELLARAASIAPQTPGNDARADQVQQLLAAAVDWSSQSFSSAEASYLGTLQSYLNEDESFASLLQRLGQLEQDAAGT